MTPDLHAAATTLAADLATLHRAGRIARLYREGMRVLVGNVPRRWGPEDNLWVAGEPDHATAYHSLWTRAGLTDDLTVQGVVLLAREAWRAPFGQLSPIVGFSGDAVDCTGWVWYPNLPHHDMAGARGPTEALAACAAIRAAAAGVGT